MRNLKNVEGLSTVEDVRCVESPVAFLSNLSLYETYEEHEKTNDSSSQASLLSQTVIFYKLLEVELLD